MVRFYVELKNKRGGNVRESVGKRGCSLGGKNTGTLLEPPPTNLSHRETGISARKPVSQRGQTGVST